jgi:5-formyltetrahydrofolate cyclo-ligase
MEFAMDLGDRKREVRASAFALRKAAFDLNKRGTAGLLSSVLAGYRGVPISGYMPIGSEINPLPAMMEAEAYGPVAMPVIVATGQPLKFSQWSPDGVLRDGPFGAQVPAIDNFIIPEIVVVPLVAFTRAGGRLGYGGGFYDRTLEKLRANQPTMAIGFAFSAQEAVSLPLEATDQPLNMIVTETEVIDVAGYNNI